MRFLVYGEPWRWGMPGSVDAALRQLGCESTLFDYTQYLFRCHIRGKLGIVLDIALFRAAAARINAALTKLISTNAFDVILICKGAHVWPETVRLARRHCAVVANWNYDEFFNPVHSSPYVDESFREYGMVLTPRRHLVSEYYTRGAQRVEYLPFCYDPGIHYPVPVSGSERGIWGGADIVFVGSWSRRREDIIGSLNGLRVMIWGSSWRHARRSFRAVPYTQIVGRTAEQADMSRALNSSLIALNILTVENRDQVNVRNLEIPACGSFQLCERTSSVLELFEEGREIACYDGVEELNEKAHYYVSHPAERQGIAESGYKRLVAGRHTYCDRVSQMIPLLKTT